MAKKQISRIHYRIGDVADMFGVNVSLIRYWEEQFDVLKPYRNAKGTRMFTPADMDNLRLIYHLVKEKRMTLKGARAQIKERRGELERTLEVIKRLEQIKGKLLDIESKLPANKKN
ncbi:MAG: MerR family transcriptional regulator [Odoribacteraceae bacterium]|jgi:DNA-binding transcriptional MerR regulator|nr:MerR family transcriptional regulator [Odoribacteraceae bacterium]